MSTTSVVFDLSLGLTKQFVEFGKNILGILQKPYQTFRSISLRKSYEQLIFIAFLIFLYLSLSTLAKESLKANPLFLTKDLVKVGLVISFTYLLVTQLIFRFGKLFGGEGKIYNFMLLWAFSLVPTLAWFLITTIFYVLLPPPRTPSLKGMAFSFLFMVFSLACFLWKGILYYLALRIGLHLSATKIAFISVLVLPLLFLYAFMLYKMKIFGVPFI